MTSADLRGLRGKTTLADGAWGTSLQQRGARPGELVELWNVDRPDAVREIAAEYVAAGSQIILTNTFRANRFVLARHDAAERVAELNRAGARLSKEAAGDRARVFGSIGPSGRLLMQHEVTEDELFEAFMTQARALAAGGVDAIVCETFFDPDEIAIAIRAVRDAGDRPLVASMTFDSGKDQTRTMMGTTPQQAAERLTREGADALGCNCGVGIDRARRVVEMMRAATQRPIWVKPNAGLPRSENGVTVYSETAEQFAAQVPTLLDAGADIVGGCCGTSPEFIRAVAKVLNERNA